MPRGCDSKIWVLRCDISDIMRAVASVEKTWSPNEPGLSSHCGRMTVDYVEFTGICPRDLLLGWHRRTSLTHTAHGTAAQRTNCGALSRRGKGVGLWPWFRPSLGRGLFRPIATNRAMFPRLAARRDGIAYGREAGRPSIAQWMLNFPSPFPGGIG